MVYLQIIFLVFLLGFIFWVGSHLYSSIFYVPYVNSNQKAIFDALKLADLKNGELMIDLGSGRGDALIIANRDFGAKTIGFEISPLPYLLSRLKTFKIKNVDVIFGDFKNAKATLKNADVLYLYLFNSVLEKNEKWIFANINKNCRIVSLAFKFKNHKPKKIIRTQNLGRETNIYLY